MSWKIFTPLEIDGDVHEFSNVNPANEAVRDWVEVDNNGVFKVGVDIECCLTYKIQPNTEKDLQKNIRYFKEALRRRCMNRGDQRTANDDPKYDLKIVGFREGKIGKSIHYHVVFRVPDGKSFIEFKTAIRDSWRKVYGSGYQFDFQYYRGAKTIQYSAKEIGLFETDGLCSDLTNL